MYIYFIYIRIYIYIHTYVYSSRCNWLCHSEPSFVCDLCSLNHCAYFDTLCGVGSDWPSCACTRTQAHKHTHRVPVDNVGNWVLGCCFRLTDSSPFLILCSYTPSLSTSASLSFHFFLWFSDTTGIETCAAPNMLCGLHFEIEIAQSPCCRWPHSATHPCTLLPASCSPARRGLMGFAVGIEIRFAFSSSLFHSCFPNKWPIFLMHC